MFKEGDLQAKLCLIVPCYNEARRLDVQSFRSYLSGTPDSRLVFVDDGSTDNTVEVLQRICDRLEDRAGILPCTVNGGKAEAVRRGVLYALDRYSPRFVGFWDADLATPLDAVGQFLKVLEEEREIEMIFGSRVKLLGRHVERKALRHYLGRVFATAVSTMLRLPIYDTQCGAKIFRTTDRTRQVFAEGFISNWVFDVEIIARYLNLYRGDARFLEKIIYEFPLEKWVDVAGSKVRAMDFVTAFVDVAMIKWRYVR